MARKYPYLLDFPDFVECNLSKYSLMSLRISEESIVTFPRSSPILLFYTLHSLVSLVKELLVLFSCFFFLQGIN